MESVDDNTKEFSTIYPSIKKEPKRRYAMDSDYSIPRPDTATGLLFPVRYSIVVRICWICSATDESV